MTRRQGLLLSALLVVCCATIQSRSLLPPWLFPEYWGLRPSPVGTGVPVSQMIQVFGIEREVRGRHTLLLGDSMIMACPWPADKITMINRPVDALTLELAREGRRRSWQRIVLWPGTAQFLRSDDVPAFVRDVAALVTEAKTHAPDVVVIAPLGYGAEQRPHIVAFHAKESPEEAQRLPAETLTRARAALEQLRTALDVPVYDPSPIQRLTIEPGRIDALTWDGLHLSPEGFDLLRAELERAGLRWQEAGAG